MGTSTPDADVVEGEVVEVNSRAVVAAPIHVQSGLAAVANLSDEEFNRNLALIQKSVDRAGQLQAALLVVGTDYGTVPGINRPFLHQPGAEKLEKAYGLASSFTVDRYVGDGEAEPELEFIVHALIHVGDTTGPVIAEGIGEASSWEKKYRWRKGERLCPDCGKPGVRWVASRNNFWHPADAKPDGGCGGNFRKDDPRITDQETGQVANDDPWDLANTLIKMAAKRAHVAGILRATGTSHLFTQDDDSPVVTRQNTPRQPVSAPAAASAPQADAGVTSSPSAAPGASTAGTDAREWTLVISEQPEKAVRIVRDGHTPPRWEGPRDKLELVGKIGNRKHTAMVLGPLAGAVAEAVDAGRITVDTPVRLVGAVLEEIKWAEDKPPRKELWGAPPEYLIEDVLIPEGDGWLSLSPAGLFDQAPADPTPTPTSPSSSGPTSTGTSAEPPARKAGTPGTWEALELRVDEVTYVMHGTTEVAILRSADVGTGELVIAALANDIEEQIGPKGELLPGTLMNAYGEWKSAGRFVIDTIGRKP